jgi:hypothetical protein
MDQWGLVYTLKTEAHLSKVPSWEGFCRKLALGARNLHESVFDDVEWQDVKHFGMSEDVRKREARNVFLFVWYSWMYITNFFSGS